MASIISTVLNNQLQYHKSRKNLPQAEVIRLLNLNIACLCNLVCEIYSEKRLSYRWNKFFAENSKIKHRVIKRTFAGMRRKFWLLRSWSLHCLTLFRRMSYFHFYFLPTPSRTRDKLTFCSLLCLRSLFTIMVFHPLSVTSPCVRFLEGNTFTPWTCLRSGVTGLFFLPYLRLLQHVFTRLKHINSISLQYKNLFVFTLYVIGYMLILKMI